MGPFAPPPPPGAQPPPLWGERGAPRASCSATASSSATVERDVLEVTAFARPHDYAEHFKARYGPTIAARSERRDGNGRDGRVRRRARRASATSGTAAPRTARGSRWSTCSRSGRGSRADGRAEVGAGGRRALRRAGRAPASAISLQARRRRRGLAPRGHAELAEHGGDVVVDRLRARSPASRRSRRWWRPPTSRSRTSVSRGVSPAGPAREAGRGPRGMWRTPSARRRRRRRDAARRGAERRRRRASASSRAASSSASASASARSYGKPSARPRGGRAAPVAGDRARVRRGIVGVRRHRRARPPQPAGELAARPRVAARARRARGSRRAAATTPARSPSSHACSARAAATGASRCSSPRRHREPPRLVEGRARASGSPRRALQAAEHDERGAEADAGLLAELERRVRVGLGRGPVAAQQPQAGARAEQVLDVAVEAALEREAQRRGRCRRRRAGRRGGASACPSRG